MGKVIATQISGMSWTAKVSLVLLCTLLTSVFMYEGWYKPRYGEAATVAYNFTLDSTSVSLGADGNTSTSATSGGAGKFSMVTATPATRSTNIGSNTLATGSAETTIGTVYGPAYATPQNLTSPVLQLAVSRNSSQNTETWKAYVYDYDPAGSAGNGSLLWTSGTATQSSSTASAIALTFTSPPQKTIAANHRIKIVVVASGTSGNTANLYARVSATVNSVFTVTEASAGPTVTSLSTNSGQRGQTFTGVTVTGTGFASGATVTFSGTGVTASNTSFVSSTQLTTDIAIDSGAAFGYRDVTVTSGTSGTLPNGFQVVNLSAPSIGTVNPSALGQGATNVSVDITGTNFVNGGTPATSTALSVSSTGVSVNSITVNSTTSLTANLSVTGTAATGARDLTVTNPDASTSTKFGGLTINSRPTLTTATPAFSVPNTTLSVTLAGTGFVTGALVDFGAGITVNTPITYTSANSMIVNITVAPTATLGSRTVTVTNPDFGTNSAAIFNIAGPAPTVTSVTPSQIGRGANNIPFTITGTNFNTNAVVTRSNANLTLGSVTVVNSTTITGTFTYNSSASTSTITVTNPDTQAATSGTITLTTYPGTPTIAPTSQAQGYSGNVTITSSNLVSGAKVSFSNPGITVNGTPTLSGATTLTANITIADNASGTSNVTVTNPDYGTRTANGIFSVTAAAPSVASAAPNGAFQGDIIDVAIGGRFFVSGATVAFSGAGITVNSVTYNNSTSLTANISVSGSATLGARDITVKNPSGTSGTGTGLFTVSKRPETITGAMTFTNVTETGMTVKVYFGGDSFNDNSCEIKYGTTYGSYPTTASAVKGDGVYTAVISALPKGLYGEGRIYYFQATFSSPHNVTGTNPVLGSQATKASALMHNSQNLGSDKWPQGWGVPNSKYGTFKCATCHGEPTTGNNRMVSTTITSPSLENWSSSGTASLSVTFRNPNTDLGNDSAHATSARPCEVCHRRTEHHLYNNPGADHMGTVNCTSCHSHGTGFSADSAGGRNCTLCHAALVTSMSAGTGSYHHSVNAAAVATYPTSATPADAEKSCLECHSDHNIFRSDLNVANDIGRAANLRIDATIIPVAGAPGATYSNTDFVAGAANGGICVSCHLNAQTKSTVQKNDGTTQTPTITKAEFSLSMHNYTATSTFKKDKSLFVANCVKCHNDTSAKRFQVSARNQFATHTSSVRRILGALGNPAPTDPYDEAFCYRCHSRANEAIPGGGLKKSANNLDWYGSRSMDDNAIDTFASFYTNPATTPAAKANGHKPVNYAGIHKPSPTEETLAFISANKHVECTDCHNTHAAQNNPVGGARGNLVAPASVGVSGVSTPTWPANWTAPAQTAYAPGGNINAALADATYEWQICFKCHSGAIKSSTGWFNNMTTTSLGAARWTDLGLAFNPNNKSYHPVVQALPSTQRLIDTQLVNGWTPGMVMSCTDCHATDSAASKGPHGSGVKWMLAGTNKAWPYTSASNNGTSSGTLFTWSTRTTNSGTTNGLFCLNCHPSTAVNTGHSESNHSSAACVNCHIRVPHGGKVSRLITTHTAGLPARYAPSGNGGSWTGMTGIVKPTTPSGYSENNNCKTDCGHHSGGPAGESW